MIAGRAQKVGVLLFSHPTEPSNVIPTVRKNGPLQQVQCSASWANILYPLGTCLVFSVASSPSSPFSSAQPSSSSQTCAHLVHVA